MKVFDLTPAQIGCGGTALLVGGLVAWGFVVWWVFDWAFRHIRFV